MRGAFGGSWDWSCQRLTRRALERYKEKIRTWKQKTLARVEKKVKNEGLTIVFIDESGLNLRTLQYLGATGKDTSAAISLQLEDAVGDRGTWWSFYFRLFPGAIHSPQIIEFPAHRGMVCLTSQPRRARLWLEFLPA